MAWLVRFASVPKGRIFGSRRDAGDAEMVRAISVSEYDEGWKRMAVTLTFTHFCAHPARVFTRGDPPQRHRTSRPTRIVTPPRLNRTGQESICWRCRKGRIKPKLRCKTHRPSRQSSKVQLANNLKQVPLWNCPFPHKG